MTDDEFNAFLDLPEAQANGKIDTTEYIWITRWQDFQHYRPERDRGPAWIKDYTKQMLDERYLRLTDRARALLRDMRDVFAMNAGRLPRDTRTITRHRHRQTRDADLLTLNHAGFIEFISRETLDQRLEQLYSPPRARVEVEEEVEKEPPNPRRRGDSKPRSRKTKVKTVCPDCEVGGGQHTEDCPQVTPANDDFLAGLTSEGGTQP